MDVHLKPPECMISPGASFTQKRAWRQPEETKMSHQKETKGCAEKQNELGECDVREV